MNKRIALFVAHGSEDIETIGALDVFRRAKLEVDFISIEDTKDVVLSRQSKVKTDKLLSEVDLSDYQVFYIPGGLGWYQDQPGGVAHFLDSQAAPIKKFWQENINDQNLLFCAICAAPQVFYEWGLLKDDTKVTNFSGVEKGKYESNYVDQKVVKSGNIMTSKGAGTTIDFALAIVEVLLGESAVKELKQGLQI